MKKIFLALLICISLIFASPMQSLFATATETATTNRTIFVVNAKYVANSDNGVFLYDDSDKCLKLLNNSPSLSTSYYVGECVDMCGYGGNIYLLTNQNIVVFDTLTHQTSSIEVNGLQSYHQHISVGQSNDKIIICLYPSDTANNQNVLYGNISQDNTEFFSIEFVQNDFNRTTTISGLKFVEYNNLSYLIKFFGKSITAFPFSAEEEFDGNIVLNTASTLEHQQDDESDSDIVDLECLKYNTSSLLAINYENKTDIYEFTGSALTFKSTLSHRYNQNGFECLSSSTNGNSIAILSNHNDYYMANYTDLGLDFSSSMTNPSITITKLSASDFEYYKATTATQLISQLGTNQTTDIAPNSVLVKIANATLSDNSNLMGYEYVMYTQFDTLNQTTGKNLYGYVINDNSQLEKLNQTTLSKTVKVFENTKLYSLPSIISDENSNLIKLNISANVPVKILSNIQGYEHCYNDTTTSYALVQVDENIGFIDTKTIVSSDQRIILVIPNAQLLADSDVYEKSDIESDILHQLHKSKRIKVLEGRNSDGFMKIAYNDEEGNYFEGYIKAQNVTADSYSTTQIIGMVLVLLNCIFLIILLMTKRKVTS